MSKWSKLCNVELPFEFRALNVALEAISSFLDARANDLELDAHLALYELTSKVNLLLNSLCFRYSPPVLRFTLFLDIQ